MTDKEILTQHQDNYDEDIVCFFLDDHLHERERLYPFLSEDEKQRASRYRFDKHRHRFISSRGKLREILAENGKCQPEEINFGFGKYGKPYINAPVSLKHMHFNASASGSIGAVAISSSSSLGLDLEYIKHEEGHDFDLIAKNEFTAEEFDWFIQHDNGKDRDRAFYTLWTCKEAYLKALGVGLNKELDKFSVNLLASKPVISHTELEYSNKSELFLYQLNIADDVITCLALANADCHVRIIHY